MALAGIKRHASTSSSFTHTASSTPDTASPACVTAATTHFC